MALFNALIYPIGAVDLYQTSLCFAALLSNLDDEALLQTPGTGLALRNLVHTLMMSTVQLSIALMFGGALYFFPDATGALSIASSGILAVDLCWRQAKQYKDFTAGVRINSFLTLYNDVAVGTVLRATWLCLAAMWALAMLGETKTLL